MKFDTNSYSTEMKTMVDKAIARMQEELPGFEIFTTSIWTEPNAAVSTISFDNKNNSDLVVQKTNEWSQQQQDKYKATGDTDQAKLFEERLARNTNPADFALRDLEEVNNTSFPRNWEDKTEGDCWLELEPALAEIGAYAFDKLKVLNLHADFELAVNGREDWYELTWPKK